LKIEFPATCPPAIVALDPHAGLLRALRRAGGEGSFLHRDTAAPFGLTCRYSRSPGLEKRKLAPMLVIGSPEGPRVPMTWVACAQTRPFSSVRVKTMRDAAHSKRHRRDIRRSQKLPDQTVSLACFGHVPFNVLTSHMGKWTV